MRVGCVGRLGRVVHMKRNNRVRSRTKRALFYSRPPETPSCPVALKPRDPRRACNPAQAVAGLPS
ncbi:hypothetical protein DIE22_23275 [Burkholderia sp. Bp9142]|nr:hypothetical protein DIE22_23275 [Burkholderia sp. Bp9142]RQR50954.1 hypothetical protein DIE21_15675 [Burkholderia sp. Bp9140]